MDKQIRDLTELASGAIVTGDWHEIQKNNSLVSQKVSNQTLTELEAAVRALRDNAIIAGVGLDTDGTYIAPVGTNFIDGSGDVMAALVLLDTAIGNIGGLVVISLVMSAANVQACEGAPIEIVAASGADTYIEIVSAFAHNEYTSDPFAIAGGGKLVVQFDGGATHLIEWSEAFIEAVVDTTNRGTWTSNVEILLNTKLEVTTTDTVVPDGNDDGVITVFLAYIIRTV